MSPSETLNDINQVKTHKAFDYFISLQYNYYRHYNYSITLNQVSLITLYNYYNHYKSKASTSNSFHLHIRKFTPKVLTNQFDLLEVMTCPVTSSQAYFITTTFQSNPSSDDSCVISKVVASLVPHFIDKEKPHNPKLPSKEEL